MSLYTVIVGAVGTVTADGRAVYHRLGDTVELVESEAERLLGLKAVEPADQDPPKGAEGSQEPPKTHRSKG